MSHTVKIDVAFKAAEIHILRKALTAKGWQLQENTMSRQYTGQAGPYRYVAVNPGKAGNSYDIGINVDGENLDFRTDYYGGSIEASLGPQLQGLKQEFAAAVIEDEYPNATVSRSTDASGNIILDVEQWG